MTLTNLCRIIGVWGLIILFSLPAKAQTLQQSQEAANGGDAQAQYTLGLRYFTGDGVAENFATSAQWFAKAAAQGHAGAQNHLGRYYHEGLGVTQDRAQALHWLEQAAQSGDPSHLFDLAKVLETDPSTVTRAAQLYDQASQGGLAEASVSLGVLYQDGRGVAQDHARAKTLYEGPAQQGHPRALNNLGLLYVRGTGVPQDYARAAGYFEAAAKTGLKTAMTNLGVLYQNGFGVPLDEDRAAELYRAAGSSSQDNGQSTGMGYVYDARLLPLDQSQPALEQIQKLAKAGDPVATFQLGWALMQNPAPPFASQRNAAALFEQGAKAGHGPSMANLGIMYFRGAGLPQDYVLGHKWLLVAKSLGVEKAGQTAAQLSAKMTPAQINESQALAQVYLAHE